MALTVYCFTQQINYPVLLQNSIGAAGLATSLHHIETLGSGSSMLVSLWFNDILNESDHTTLNDLMASYANPSNGGAMITAVVAAIQDDSKLMLLLRTRTSTLVASMSYGELQAVCAILSITP